MSSCHASREGLADRLLDSAICAPLLLGTLRTRWRMAMTRSTDGSLRMMASTSFATLEGRLSVRLALERLGGRQWGVILLPDGTPVSIVKTSELSSEGETGELILSDSRAPTYPAAMVDGDLTLAAL